MSKIEWTEKTWNPMSGCTKISDGCKNCYAETMAKRLKAMGIKEYENGFAVTLHPSRLREPLERKKPTMYFVSMGDLFHEDVPFEFIDRVFAIIALTPHLTYQILTKRPERMRQYFERLKINNVYYLKVPWENLPVSKGYGDLFVANPPFTNVWLGVTAENQEQADKRIPILLDIPTAVRFVSIEPMLGAVDLSSIICKDYYKNQPDFAQYWTLDALRGNYSLNEPVENIVGGRGNKLDWVIVGGETGAKTRPLQYEWVKSIQAQCEAARVPFFFKKWGKIAYQRGQAMTNAKVFEGIIDGVECRAMPKMMA